MKKRVKQKTYKKKHKKKQSYWTNWYIPIIILMIWVISCVIRTEYIIRQIDRDPVEVYAYVFDRNPNFSGKGYPEYIYRFRVNGIMYYGYANKRCHVGDRILIRYLRTDPSKNRSVNNGVIIRPE